MQNSSKYPLVRTIQKNAHTILDAEGAGNRLTLVLGLFVATGMGLFIPILLDCVALLVPILGGTAGVWFSVIYEVLFWGSLLFVTLPLCMAVYRMAVSMVSVHDALCPDTLMPPKIRLYECLYPFTSAKAYKRTLVAGLQVVLHLGGTVLLPWCFVRLTNIWLPTIIEMTSAPVFMTLAQIGVAILLGLVWLLVGCKYHGYAYLVFAHPEMSLKDCIKRHRNCKKPGKEALRLTWVSLGRGILGALLVWIPLFLHTLPSLMLSWAVYDRDLFDR